MGAVAGLVGWREVGWLSRCVCVLLAQGHGWWSSWAPGAIWAAVLAWKIAVCHGWKDQIPQPACLDCCWVWLLTLPRSMLKLWNPHSNQLPWVPLLPLLTVWGGALLSEFELVSLEKAYMRGPLYAWLCGRP